MIKMKPFHYTVLLLCTVMLAACEDKYPTDDNLRDGVVRVADYLYQSDYNEYNPAKALRFTQTEGLLSGACTAVRNGQYVGRNFDWYYDTSVEFIIRVPHSGEHYASVGIAGAIPIFTAKIVESGADSEFYDCLPYVTLDGINENGVFCSINVLPAEDVTPTDNTLPGADSLSFLMVPRYVLDNASSAEEAVELLRGVNIVSTKVLSLECHFMIADSTCTYVVEWINGQLQAVRDSFQIMTNYYLLQPMTAHSMGIERYNLAKENYSTASDLAGMTKLMHMLRLSRMYDRSVSPFWYSEYNGNWTQYGLGDLTIASEPADYEKCIKNDISHYRLNKRDWHLDVWHTMHTAIYDLSAISVLYYVQEDYSQFYKYTVEP